MRKIHNEFDVGHECVYGTFANLSSLLHVILSLQFRLRVAKPILTDLRPSQFRVHTSWTCHYIWLFRVQALSSLKQLDKVRKTWQDFPHMLGGKGMHIAYFSVKVFLVTWQCVNWKVNHTHVFLQKIVNSVLLYYILHNEFRIPRYRKAFKPVVFFKINAILSPTYSYFNLIINIKLVF